MRLPQLNLNALYPDQKFGLTYQLDNQFVRFDHRKDFNDLTKPDGATSVIGDRFSVSPTVSLPIHWASAYTVPKLSIATIGYQLKNQNLNQPTSLNKITPIFSLDNGLFFNKNLNFFNVKYIQTLEPRLYYLFVPARNQDEFPVFDTTLPAFSFDSVFRNNRFAGIDRLGDANQVALAVTTRFLDDYSGEEKMSASIGQVYAFEKHKVCLPDNPTSDPNCKLDPLAQNRLSPIAGNLKYAINPSWNASLDAAWEPSDKKLNNGAVTLQYHNSNNRIINFGYNFLKEGDALNGKTKDLNRIDISFAWPIRQNWSIVGDWNYNLSYVHPQTYFYGLQYDSCCFAIRLIQGKTFLSVDRNNQLDFDRKTYLQFLLKGLGSVESTSTNDMLTSRISNYNDIFKTR